MVGGPAIDDRLVRHLLRTQHPDLAELELGPVEQGWDNAVLRLGPDLAVRLPRREAAVGLVQSEQWWLPVLAPTLPLAGPVPVRAGRPDEAFPWPWSVCRWIEGRTLLDDAPSDTDAAAALGRFLGALHRPAPSDAPANPYRGVPLAERTARLEDALATLGRGARRLDPATARAVRARWAELVDTPPWAAAPVWLHGDLHPGNLVASATGELTGVLDWGDLTAGDPATDLAVAWMLGADWVDALRAAAAHLDGATWARAEAWALALAVSYLEGSPDGSPLLGVADATLARLLD